MYSEEQVDALLDGVRKLYQWFGAKVKRCRDVAERNSGDHLFALESERVWCEGVIRMMDDFGLNGVNLSTNPLGKARDALLKCKRLIQSEQATVCDDMLREEYQKVLDSIEEAF